MKYGRYKDMREIHMNMARKDARVQAEQRRHDALTPYQLPDGAIVLIREDVARGARHVSFQMKGGQVVEAVRVTAAEPTL